MERGYDTIDSGLVNGSLDGAAGAFGASGSIKLFWRAALFYSLV